MSAGHDQRSRGADSSRAEESAAARTVDVPAAGQPIRQNQAAVRERLMPKLAEMEQVGCHCTSHSMTWMMFTASQLNQQYQAVVQKLQFDAQAGC